MVLHGFERGSISCPDGKGIFNYLEPGLNFTKLGPQIGNFLDRKPPVIGEHGHLYPGEQLMKLLDLFFSVSSSQIVSSFL